VLGEHKSAVRFSDAPDATPAPQSAADGEKGRNVLVRNLALPRSSPRTGLHPVAPEGGPARDAEDTGKTDLRSVFSGPEATNAGVAELADAQDSKS
jgi:hypothetical protein